MLVAAVTAAVGAVCFYYGARALRTGRSVRRLLGDGPEAPEGRGPRHPTDWLGPADEGPVESGDTGVERGSIERGVVLLALGVLCLLFGLLAA